MTALTFEEAKRKAWAEIADVQKRKFYLEVFGFDIWFDGLGIA